jgi:hypothetical protein
MKGSIAKIWNGIKKENASKDQYPKQQVKISVGL